MINSDEVFGAVSVYGNRGANQSAELPVETEQDDLLSYELLTLASYDASDIEDGCIEVYGEDANGNEGSWTVSTPQLASLACGRINQQELRIKELEAHLFAVTESLKHFTHAAKTGEGLMQAVMSAETVLESTPKQSLESVTRADGLNEIKAKAVMGLTDMILGAFASGFVDSNELTLSELYRIAQCHVKDNYQHEAPFLNEVTGEEFAKMCAGKNSEANERCANTDDMFGGESNGC